MKTRAGTRAVRPVSLNIVLHGKNHSSYTIYTVSTHMDTLIVHQGSGQYLDLRGRLQGSILSSALKRSPLRLRKSLISFSSLYRTLPHPPPPPPLPPSTQSPQIFYSFSSCVVTPSWRYSIFSSLNQIQFLPLSPVCKPKSVNSSTVFFLFVFFFNLMCSSSLPLIWLSVYKRTGRVHLACARYKCSHSPLINQLHLSIKTLFFPISVFQFESVFYCESGICCGSDITTWMPRKRNPFRLRIYGGCVCVVRQTVYCVYTRSE